VTDIKRLRELAGEPERTAMSRSQQYPSMSAQLLAQKSEIDALRRGLLDAVAEIERLMGLADTPT
jgi:hypothetical protein